MTQRILFIIAMLALTGCMTRGSRVTSPDQIQIKNQVLELQKIQGKQAATIEELNNKILLLKDQLDNGKTVPVITTAPAPAPEKNPASNLSGQERLWARALANAKKPELYDLQKDVEILLKSYKSSPITNNALYLLAHTFYERGNFTQAALKFEQLYKNYPDGNKAVASLYKLGLCYQKLGRKDEAREALHNVVALYPGSREATQSEAYLARGETVQ
ncbi:MAG: tetratricopeptide repeat protein [Oligoflexia bacterium]|nr:tetratricopeptide repeat protein [Oligoflexia bacterium]